MMERVYLSEEPFPMDLRQAPYNRGKWDAHWISCQEGFNPSQPLIATYRLKFTISEPMEVVVHVTADERYRLRLDGQVVARGSERGDADNWYYESFKLQLPPGTHVLAATVWSFRDRAPYAQMTVGHGFLLGVEDKNYRSILGTGFAPWEVSVWKGFSFNPRHGAFAVGDRIVLDANKQDLSVERGEGPNWVAAIKAETAVRWDANDVGPRHRLRAATLPPMWKAEWHAAKVRHVSLLQPNYPTVPIFEKDNLREWVAKFQQGLNGGGVIIPPNTNLRVIIDLDLYACVYPRLRLHGGAGARIKVGFLEGLFEKAGPWEKGNRNEIEGKWMRAMWTDQPALHDTLILNGAVTEFEPLWWNAGRYVEVVIENLHESLYINEFKFIESRYPLTPGSVPFASANNELNKIQQLGIRTLMMCSHETFMDCPYFEQLQYIGDTRIQALVTMILAEDDRLVRKALQMLDWSRTPNTGFTQSRYPSNSRQIIPPFGLWLVGMVYDYGLWRGDRAFLKSLLPGCRSVIDAFEMNVVTEGEHRGWVAAPEGWNFVDWVQDWKTGVPPGGEPGELNTALNLQVLLAMQWYGDLCRWLGFTDPYQSRRDELRQVVKPYLEKDGPKETTSSLHTLCLAALDRELIKSVKPNRLDRDLSGRQVPTIYFMHYLFEALAAKGRADDIVRYLNPIWTDQLRMGMTTLVEKPEPSRSDCHAWSAHPVYHLVANVAGLRPKSFGGEEFLLDPQIPFDDEVLVYAYSKFGKIQVKIARSGNEYILDVEKPYEVKLFWRKTERQLTHGPQQIRA